MMKKKRTCTSGPVKKSRKSNRGGGGLRKEHCPHVKSGKNGCITYLKWDKERKAHRVSHSSPTAGGGQTRGRRILKNMGQIWWVPGKWIEEENSGTRGGKWGIRGVDVRRGNMIYPCGIEKGAQVKEREKVEHLKQTEGGNGLGSCLKAGNWSAGQRAGEKKVKNVSVSLKEGSLEQRLTVGKQKREKEENTKGGLIVP